MSIVLNGNASNVTAPLSATITALANNGSGAVRVTTSAPHLFGSNDFVALNTTEIGGIWQITVIDATHFDVVGSIFIATSAGSAIDLSLTPQVQVPTDGDTFSMQLSGMLSAIQACLDRDQYIAKQLAYACQSLTFTSSGTWTVPAGVNAVTCIGVGGGGGGGGGGASDGTNPGASGGGGGGAMLGQQIVSVTPGTVVSYTIGAGGIGGVGDIADAGAAAGGSGADTIFNGVVIGKGASGGRQGGTALAAASYVYGGPPVPIQATAMGELSNPQTAAEFNAVYYALTPPQWGGFGSTQNTTPPGRFGGSSPCQIGGAAGTVGTVAGGGGGGASGWSGIGYTVGAGGPGGSTSGASAGAGTTGTQPGSGGGGAGAQSDSSSGRANGVSGGSGATGILTIQWYQP